MRSGEELEQAAELLIKSDHMRQYEVIHLGLVATSLADSEDRPLDLKARAHAAFRDVPSTRAQVAVGLVYRILACTTERDFNVKFDMPFPDAMLPKQLDRSERPRRTSSSAMCVCWWRAC